jgi:Transposase.
MTTPHDDRYLTICALRRHLATARELQQDLTKVTGVTVSDQTVRNWLREMSLWPIRPVQVPCLMQQHRAAFLLFVHSHVNWQLHQWRSVLFTDESKFALTQHDGRQRVCRCRGEQYMPNVVQEGDRFSQGSVMVLSSVVILLLQGTLNRYCYSMCWLLHTVLALNLY